MESGITFLIIQCEFKDTIPIFGFWGGIAGQSNTGTYALCTKEDYITRVVNKSMQKFLSPVVRT